jgi:hypothetical protein
MPVHIDELTSEVAIMSGDLPLTEAQVNKLVKLVIRRTGEKQREARLTRESTEINQSSTPAPNVRS